MPPKSAKKAKEQTPDPPKDKQELKTPSAPKKSATRIKKEPPHYETVKKINNAPLAIDVAYQGWSSNAVQQKGGAYTHHITLTAPAAFSLQGTFMYTDGDFEGSQALLIRPAQPFPFMKLPKELRARIYNFYFAQKGVPDAPILLDGKRANKDIYAKTYSEGFQYRVGLLTVNKEIHTESHPHLYTLRLRLDSTATLLDFLSQIPAPVRLHLHSLSIKNFIKTSSRNAMHFLAESRNLERLHIDLGVFGEADAAKAAKQFYAEAYKFLEAVGAAKGRKDAGVDVLSFGPQALTSKDAKNEAKPWSEALVKEFKDNLRAKLK